MAASTPELIKTAVERFMAELPALAKLKLVFGLELRGRGDVQAYRVEVPGPNVRKGFGEDERVRISIARSHFNELATEGRLREWREAYERGQIKTEGDREIQRLIGTLVQRQMARARLKKAR